MQHPKRDIPITDTAMELDLSEDTVRRDIKRGAPHSRHKGRIELNVPEYRAWRESKGLTGEPGRPVQGDSPTLEKVRIRKENALANKYELQVKREKGELVPLEEFKRWINEHITSAKNKLLGLGARVTPELEGLNGAERQSVIDQRVIEILGELGTA